VRRPFLAGNWKMNLARRSALELALAVREHLGRSAEVDVAVAPPFVYVDEVARALLGSPVLVGGQNCCDEEQGAFTGEVSAAMLADVGARFVILGHSERRHLYGEGDELVSRKVRRALASGLDVILCVGETLAQREARRTEAVVREQLTRGLEGVSQGDLARVTIAYEPVWAIGTGKNATPQQAGEVHSYLRGLLSGLFSEPLAERVRIQYGGSVNPGNVSELLAVPDVDGALVGGASLKAESFLILIDHARRASEAA
jgi:triosephosphate isomerase